MKPHEVADRLEIAIPTVRLWATEYRHFLSPQAAGGGGRHRDFNEQDLRILYFIQQQKQTSIPAAEIHLTLERLQADNWEDLPHIPERPNMAAVPVVPEAAAQAALDAERRTLFREIATLQERLEKVEAQLEEERAGREALLQTERAEREKLLRELSDLNAKLAEAQTELRLYRSGRLKPEE
jgi:DNA-binding transcriptional MerR regulator